LGSNLHVKKKNLIEIKGLCAMESILRALLCSEKKQLSQFLSVIVNIRSKLKTGDEL
jgi:hypothetical protein